MTPRSWAVHAFDRLPAGIAHHLDSSSRAASAFRPLVNLLVPFGPTEVTVRSGLGAGLRMVIDPRSEKYYWTGTYQTEVTEELERILAPGGVFWDVGAHVGYVAAIAARLVGSSGTVMAFEPLPANLARLRLTMELNSLGNVVVRPVAVAARPGKLPFHVHSSSSMGSLRPHVGEIEVVEVEATSLDEEVRTSAAPTLLKIDVEGAEVDVLEGARQLLSEVRPAVIVECLSGDALRQCTERLPGYRFRALDRTNYLGEA